MRTYAAGPIITERRRTRDTFSFSAGTHYPDPYQDAGGRWRCHDCEQRLRTYLWRGERRLRHYYYASAA